MRQRLILLYELNKIDKELQELYSLKGDIPLLIAELSENKNEKEQTLKELTDELNALEENEKILQKENETHSQKIDRDDNLLRAGAVKTNQEYNALAKEIEDAYEFIGKNDAILEKEIKVKKAELTEQHTTLRTELDELEKDLVINTEKLATLNEQTEEEERELKKQREELVPKIIPEDLEYYNRINNVRFGDTMAVVRKGSCLGCYNSIPPQRVIEIRMADKFFHCESCGRILISEELIDNA
ncbi:MAG: C4-type zinc ribbon domain-containing protein [Ignavibacteria bacterium]|jgi:predicted  nucleic acid-binding Zn-ribbon protein